MCRPRSCAYVRSLTQERARQCSGRLMASTSKATLTRLKSVSPAFGAMALELPETAQADGGMERRYEGNPCNGHLLGLGQRIKKSIVDAGLIGYQFGAVGVSDGISMGTFGMSYSLPSRDLIADSVESAAGGHWLDGMVVVPGCDKCVADPTMSILAAIADGKGLAQKYAWDFDGARQTQPTGTYGLRGHHPSRLLRLGSSTRYCQRVPIVRKVPRGRRRRKGRAG